MSDRLFDEYNKAILSDIRGSSGNDITVEINFSEKEELRDCVKMTMDGKSAIIPISELHTLVWSVANEQQRDDLTPLKQTLVRKLVKRHIVEAKRDIKKGQMINVRCETNVPLEIYEGLKGLMPKRNPTTRATAFSVPIIGK